MPGRRRPVLVGPGVKRQQVPQFHIVLDCTGSVPPPVPGVPSRWAVHFTLGTAYSTPAKQIVVALPSGVQALQPLEEERTDVLVAVTGFAICVEDIPAGSAVRRIGNEKLLNIVPVDIQPESLHRTPVAYAPYGQYIRVWVRNPARRTSHLAERQ